jgi:hypothetical protein
MSKTYQLSLDRKPGRFTDSEWVTELKTRQARNASFRLRNHNFNKSNNVQKYVAWLDGTK